MEGFNMNLNDEDQPLILYLKDEETEADSGFGKELNYTIQLTPSVAKSLASRTDTISLTRNEIISLADLDRHDIFVRLFAKFGENDLSVRDGYPKGPYFSVNEEVYEEIIRQAKMLQA
jgi:hypothetical protein